jgi:hypothetical protein
MYQYRPPIELAARVIRAVDAVPHRPLTFTSLQVAHAQETLDGEISSLSEQTIENLLVVMPQWFNNIGEHIFSYTPEGLMAVYAIQFFFVEVSAPAPG